jgi:hypothetical protein
MFEGSLSSVRPLMLDNGIVGIEGIYFTYRASLL